MDVVGADMPSSERPRLLITGATGFVGRHLVDYLRHRNLALRVQVHDQKPPSEWSDLERVHGSLADWSDFGKWVEGVDYVIHAAADTDVTGAVKSPERSLQLNCLATMHLLDEFRDSPVKRFVYLSSARIYGRVQYLPIDERHPYFVEDPYGASKLAGGLYVDLYHRLYGIPTVNLVVFSVYGRGQRPHGNTGVAAIFCRKVVEGEDITILGDGSLRRDLIHVRDVCRAVELSLNSSKAIGETYNVATGVGTTMLSLAQRVLDIGRQCGFKGTKIRYADPLPGDVSNTADVTKIRKHLGFEPEVALDEGIREYIVWYAKQKALA